MRDTARDAARQMAASCIWFARAEMHQAAFLCHSTELKGRGALWVSLSKAVGSRLESCCEMPGLPWFHCSCALSGWLLCRLCKREGIS